jgi:hypothetical protein
MEKTGERGPIYGVELIDSLPIGTGGFVQAMPSRSDLNQARRTGDRLVAGYEVLLRHYSEAVEEIARLNQVVKEQQATIGDKCDECSGFAHVIIESGFVPGVDSDCRCDECQSVAKGMAGAGYLNRVKDQWWDNGDE